MTTTEIRPEHAGLRERKKQQTRNAIHEAAFGLVDEYGLEATTVEQICQRADVSTRTFFNYFSSKAAAALEFQSSAIHPNVRSAFREAEGSLVMALCDVIGSSPEHGPSLARMKQLLGRHPELVSSARRVMGEVRELYVSLAAERATSRAQAELAVALVMTALATTMYENNPSDAPIGEQLKAKVEQLIAVSRDELQPVRPAS